MRSLAGRKDYSVMGQEQLLLHITFNNQTCNLRNSIGTDSNSLLEMTGEFISTVVCNIDNTRIARLDRFLGEGRNGAAATGNGLMDYQRSGTCVLKNGNCISQLGLRH